MTRRVLLVDDEENVLHGYERNLHRRFEISTATSGRDALALIEHSAPFAVLVADMRMPGMSGLDLLMEARLLCPDTVRIMLTGNSDQQTAMEAVNHGRVFRFLTKPCSPDELGLAISAGIRQYELVTGEKQLLEKTLAGSIRVLSELLSLVEPDSFGRSWLLCQRVVQIGKHLGYPDPWTLEIAALLSPMGRVTLPGTLKAKLQADQLLTDHEQQLVDRICETGARLLGNIPRMEEVAAIIRYQSKGFDGSGFPQDDVKGDCLPLGARILKAVADFTDIERTRLSLPVALEELKLYHARYDPKVLEALEAQFGASPVAPTPSDAVVRVADLQEDMVLTRPLMTQSGQTILVSGTRLASAHLQMVSNLAELLDIQEPIYILRG